MHRTLIRREFTAMASAVCLALGSVAAHGATTVSSITATGTSKLGTAPTQSLLDQVASPAGIPSSSSVDVLDFPTDGTNGAGMHSYGSATGNFGTRSSGNGTYEVTGGFKILETITNDTGAAAAASFNFYITPGYLNNLIQTTLAAGDFVNAGVTFDIKVNGSSVWNSQASLVTNDQGVSTFNKSGTGAGSTDFYVGSGSSYNILGVNRAIDLGVLNAGQSLDLSYEITSYANGKSTPSSNQTVIPAHTVVVPAHWVEGFVYPEGSPNAGELCFNNIGILALTTYGGENGYGCVPGTVFVPESSYVVPEQVFDPGYGYNGSQASSGDPFDPRFNPIAVDPRGFAPGVALQALVVPEPSTYALMALGLGALGWSARRRKQQH